MQRVICLKPIFATTVSPQRQKRIRAERFSVYPRHNLKLSSSPPQNFDSLVDDDNMAIYVSDNLRQWLINKNLQRFIKVAKVEPHPRAAEILQQIDVSKITNKKVRSVLELKREGFSLIVFFLFPRHHATRYLLKTYFYNVCFTTETEANTC